MPVIPHGSHVVIRRDQPPQSTAGGIALPVAAQVRPIEGVVIAVGPGREMKRGRRQAMQLAVGDRVVFHSYAGTDLRVAGEHITVLEECDVIAQLVSLT